MTTIVNFSNYDVAAVTLKGRVFLDQQEVATTVRRWAEDCDNVKATDCATVLRAVAAMLASNAS